MALHFKIWWRLSSSATNQSDNSFWATETVLSRWLAADEDRVSHVLSHVVWWIKEKYGDVSSVRKNLE